MRAAEKRIRMVISYVLTVLLVGMYPIATFAVTAPTTGTTTPVTTSTTPAPPPPTYDPATGHWNTDSWRFDATAGKYVPVTPSALAPALTPTAIAPAPTLTPTTNTPVVTSALAPQGLGPLSTTNVTQTATSNNNTAVTTTNGINNTLGSTALTGNTIVGSNTTGGSAASGNAAAATTVMNTVNSSVGSAPGGVASFVSNISGNVNGDILLYPVILGALLAQSALAFATTTATANNTLNASTNNQLTNNLNLGATSGTAAVTGNSRAGNATSGSANAVADIMNMINSSVAANQSFIGTINIYGNLNGDILLAPNFLPQLLGSNSSTTLNQSLNANVINTDAITNNLNLSANSGAATVAGNTSAGNATTGLAKTNVVILNLTGHEIVANNSLLVFVNVLGKWVGLIVDAPIGSTAAALGNGVNQNTIVNADTTISAQTNNQITNNINLAAQSGDATVTRNTSAGNATSGNATASANILNMSQTSFGLSGWFGILFINVFGSWLGSFGIDTSAGNPQQEASGTGASTNRVPQQPQSIRFIPKPATGESSWNLNPVLSASNDANGQPPVSLAGAPAKVLAASTSSRGDNRVTSNDNAPMVAAMTIGAVILLASGLWLTGFQRAGRLV